MKTKAASKEFKAGYDAGLYGPNEDNCNFRFFATLGQTKEWERGNKLGIKKKFGR